MRETEIDEERETERKTDKEKKTMRETQRGRIIYPMCDRIDLKAKRIITQKLGGRRERESNRGRKKEKRDRVGESG